MKEAEDGQEERESGQQGLSPPVRVGDGLAMSVGWSLCLVLTWFDFLFGSAQPCSLRPPHNNQIGQPEVCGGRGVLYHHLSRLFLWRWLSTVTLMFRMMLFT